MKTDVVRQLAGQRCNADEIALALGMCVYRVRWLMRHGFAWPRRGRAPLQRRLDALAARTPL